MFIYVGQALVAFWEIDFGPELTDYLVRRGPDSLRSPLMSGRVSQLNPSTSVLWVKMV
jgi:hypothetical protein